MSEISRINLGIPNTAPKSEQAKAEAAPKAGEAAAAGASAQVNPDAMLNAMNAQARANASHFGINNIDHKKYSSTEQIERVQNSMTEFDQGVLKHSVALNEEFGYLPEYSALSEADKLAMAAQSFAQSE